MFLSLNEAGRMELWRWKRRNDSFVQIENVCRHLWSSTGCIKFTRSSRKLQKYFIYVVHRVCKRLGRTTQTLQRTMFRGYVGEQCSERMTKGRDDELLANTTRFLTLARYIHFHSVATNSYTFRNYFARVTNIFFISYRAMLRWGWFLKFRRLINQGNEK